MNAVKLVLSPVSSLSGSGVDDEIDQLAGGRVVDRPSS